mgnify:FL=1
MHSTWHDVQQHVCPTCIDGDGHGGCRLPVDEDCALRTHFSIVRAAMQSAAGDPRRPDIVRGAVCTACGLRDEHGMCWRRNRLECAFDRFLPEIIEFMEGHPAPTA